MSSSSTVVARNTGPDPISSISSSPDGRHAVIADKESLRFVRINSSSGLEEISSVRIVQHFQASRTASGPKDMSNNITRGGAVGNKLMDAFPTPQPPIIINNTITNVAWSPPQSNDSVDNDGDAATQYSNYSTSTPGSTLLNQSGSFDSIGYLNQSETNSNSGITGNACYHDSYIAAAGSNGVVIIWRSSDLLQPLNNVIGSPHSEYNRGKRYGRNLQHGKAYSNPYYDSPSSLNSRMDTVGKPEAILCEHSRAVNQLAWHPNLSGQLLTASQDTTVNLWKRRVTTTTIEEKDPPPNIVSWFAALGQAPPTKEKTIQSFSWHCVAKWKPSGSPVRDIKWSPFNDDLFALVTNDGSLLVYNTRLSMCATSIIKFLAHDKEATTLDWHPTRQYIIATGSFDKKVRVWDLEDDLSFSLNDENIDNIQINSRSHTERIRPPNSPVDPLSKSYHGGFEQQRSQGAMKRSHSFGPLRGTRGSQQKNHIHELSISGAVQTLKWRPPKTHDLSQFDNMITTNQGRSIDHHDAMLAVSTTPTTGLGGHGTVTLWSYHRPFMPLSIVEGHTEGAVSMFIWIDTPEIEEIESPFDDDVLSAKVEELQNHSEKSFINQPLLKDTDIDGDQLKGLKGTWQHILSVGRDGNCLLQSLARGERPIENVPHSTFAITNLSPFQRGYGSLQLISAHQNVPSGDNNDYHLCGLRRDIMTSMSRGVFQENPPSDYYSHSTFDWKLKSNDQGSELLGPLTFISTDRGDLNELSKLSLQDKNEVVIAPEVVHISRFADSYQLYHDSKFQTKAKICRHNGSVAAGLNCHALARMWNILASILEGSESEDILDSSSQQSFPSNPFSFMLLPTLKSLLFERADASDVQTCVVVCEVMEVIPSQRNASQHEITKTNVPGLDISLVREWYLSYIDLLQQMCLFTHATELIKYCRDPHIQKLTLQSTTFHESCPTCWKPVLRGKSECKNCRQKMGMCAICHLPVKGLFVWCSGCGHGGHLKCLLEWFSSGNSQCPTGCGHECTMFQKARASSFPRTCSIVIQ